MDLSSGWASSPDRAVEEKFVDIVFHLQHRRKETRHRNLFEDPSHVRTLIKQ